jgi:hypothetical protein
MYNIMCIRGWSKDTCTLIVKFHVASWSTCDGNFRKLQIVVASDRHNLQLTIPEWQKFNFQTQHNMTNPRMVLLVRSPFLASPTRGGLIPAQSSISSYLCRYRRASPRRFSYSVRFSRQQDGKESFGTRLRRALRETKIRWYPIPVGLGIGFLALTQLYRVNEREKIRQQEEEEEAYLRSVGKGEEHDSEGRPKRRKRIRPTGPWFVCLIARSLVQH